MMNYLSTSTGLNNEPSQKAFNNKLQQMAGITKDIEQEEWIYKAGKAIDMKKLRKRLNVDSKIY